MKEPLTDQEKFYKQANSAYNVASYKVYGDFFKKDAGTKIILILLFAPLLLLYYLVAKIIEVCRNKKGSTPKDDVPWDGLDDIKEIINNSNTRATQKAILIKRVEEEKEKWEDENPYFCPGVEDFRDISTVPDMQMIKKIMDIHGPTEIRAVLRWLLSLSEDKLDDAMRELEVMIVHHESMGKFKSKKEFDAWKKLMNAEY